MANNILTASVLAKEAVMVLDNELVMAKKVYRGYEDDFSQRSNGYKIGDTLTIRKPADFTVRDGAVMAVQDAIEGSTTIVINKRKGIDFQFTSQDLTLKMTDLSERVIKPAMVQLANQIDADCHALYKLVPSWVGTPGQLINAFSDFALGPQRLDEGAVPSDNRTAVLSPADHWALVGSQTALFTDTIVKPAYRQGLSGVVADVDLYKTQNVATFTTGSDLSGTVGASIVTSTVTYDSVKTSMQQTITTSSVNMNAGDVFTIAGVYAVNPVTKTPLSYLKQFVCISYASNSLVMYPAMIWTGAFKNVDVQGVSDLNGQAITGVGTASTAYTQNMIFHKNAFALAMVDLQDPPGAVDVGRQSYKGTRVRVIPVYDGINDISKWRLDVLYGVAAIDPRLATRISGT